MEAEESQNPAYPLYLETRIEFIYQWNFQINCCPPMQRVGQRDSDDLSAIFLSVCKFRTQRSKTLALGDHKAYDDWKLMLGVVIYMRLGKQLQG